MICLFYSTYNIRQDTTLKLCKSKYEYNNTDNITGRALSGHSFYAVEDRVMCEGCYVNTLEKCHVCKLPVTDRILRATGKKYAYLGPQHVFCHFVRGKVYHFIQT